MNLDEAMALAIAAGEGVRGSTSPNPPVGCVILDAGGRVVGEGATQPPGGAHAEVVALARAGERARGGTAVVTLEPCSHYGRTPPCTEALLGAGVARVVHAVADPNPKAAGGAEVLRAAGVEVGSGVLAGEVARGPLRAWLHFARTGRPHVTWTYVAALDGGAAIGSVESRAEMGELRAKVDAIVLGAGAVRADGAQPAARATRPGQDVGGQPVRVVVGDLPAPDDEAETMHVRTHDPDLVLAALAARGVVDVLLECGPTLAGAFAGAGRVDRVLAYLAPQLRGGTGVSAVTEAVGLVVEQVSMCGPDVRVSAVAAR
ncbi:bifunctional diaminohydroxyphosphoribosylaminopyrimidine deaminase/5-amino-6-(5-phosphoribosylamino)uracil reductase RibD [Saccharothrix stipae]